MDSGDKLVAIGLICIAAIMITLLLTVAFGGVQ